MFDNIFILIVDSSIINFFFFFEYLLENIIGINSTYLSDIHK